MNTMAFVQRIDDIIDRRSLIFRLDLMCLFLLKLTTFALLRNSVSKVETSSIETWYRYDSEYETFS